MRIAVVGPSKAGKTVYVASLLRAGLAARHAARPIKVRPAPSSPATMALDQSAIDIIRGESLAATSSVTRFDLFADLPGSTLFGIGRETLRISMVDVPGGDCMPPPGGAIHELVRDAVAEADALLLLVPADADVRPSDLVQRLAHLVGTARPTAAGKSRAPRFHRVAVAMSMAELLVADRGAGALHALDSLDARSEIARACGEELMATVRSLVPAGGDWYSLVSAYGFDPLSGEIAAERTTTGWRVKTMGREFRSNWWPYRAFEPLEFLGRGVCWREAI